MSISLFICAPSNGQSGSLRLLHEFPDGYEGSIVGDADHDGRPEIHATRLIPPNGGGYDVLERRGINDWDLALRGSLSARLDDGGDSDRDGKYEILLASAANGLEVYESVDSSSFPSQIVYTNPGIGFFQSPLRFADDLDRDGRSEILFTTANSAHQEVVVLENTNDNAYAEVARVEFGSSENFPGNVIWGDFDSDGIGDILTGDSDGNVFVIENRGNDAYELVWQYHLPTPFNVTGLAALGDADGDSLGEFAAEILSPASVWVFESVGNDDYFPAFHGSIPSGGRQTLRAADVDGDGHNDLVVGAAPRVQVWRPVANDTWEVAWDAQAGGRAYIETVAADMNNNGFAEVLYTDFNLDRAYLVEWPFRVDASQNDLERQTDALFTFRDRLQIRRIAIRADGRNITRQIHDLVQAGNPNVSLSQQGDESVLRLDLRGLGLRSGRRVTLGLSAQDRVTGEPFADTFEYVTP